jgi:hypothetical protein
MGCMERYAYRNKLSAPLKRGTVCFKIVNYSPQIINSVFEEELKEYCIKRLNKEGFNFTNKNPMFEVVLEVKVDSSINHGIAYAGPGPGTYPYSKLSKGIMLTMEAKYLKTDRAIWQDQYDLYFFNDFRRDLYRTKGVIKYMLSGINEDK